MAAIYTQEEIDALKAVIVTGALTVKYSGPPSREVTYHSLAEMRVLLAAMIADLAAAAGTTPTVRFATIRSGFYPDGE